MKKIRLYHPLSKQGFYKPFFTLLLSFTLKMTIFAQTPTWSERIAPIVYKNCTSCHRSGGVAPFPLMSYTDVKRYDLSVHHAVLTGHMPPWPPDSKYSQLAYPRALSQTDRQAIIDWVDGGSPTGNLANAPAPPVYTTNFDIPQPDYTARTPNYTITSNSDVYRCFPIRSGLTVDQFITALECIPSNSQLVHHVLIFQDQSNACFTLDAADPGAAGE